MYFIHNKEIFDLGLNLLSETYEVLDKKLVELCDKSVLSDDADQFGYYDQIEYLLGFGIIGLQTYITETASWAGLKKHETFFFGPRTSSGGSKVQILNAVANFWKHREEWVFEGEQKRKDAINMLFEEVGYSTDVDYPISGILTELLTPSEVRLASLIKPLVEWRNELIQYTKAEPRHYGRRRKAAAPYAHRSAQRTTFNEYVGNKLKGSEVIL